MHLLDHAMVETASQSKFLRALNDYQRLCALTERCGGAVRTLTAGEGGTLCPGLTYRVLAPGADGSDELESRCRDLFAEEDPDAFRQKLSALDTRMNNFSLILRLEYHGTRLLLPGDTNRGGYGARRRRSCGRTLLRGHHGHGTGVSPALLAAIQPTAVGAARPATGGMTAPIRRLWAVLSTAAPRCIFPTAPEFPASPTMWAPIGHWNSLWGRTARWPRAIWPSETSGLRSGPACCKGRTNVF